MYYYLALLFVLVINCCVMNNPKTQLKTANIYSYTVSDWEQHWRPFGLQAGTQSTEPHQPGPYTVSECQESESGLAE